MPKLIAGAYSDLIQLLYRVCILYCMPNAVVDHYLPVSFNTVFQSVSTFLYLVALYFDMYIYTKVLSGNSMNKYTYCTSLIWNSVIWHILLCGMI